MQKSFASFESSQKLQATKINSKWSYSSLCVPFGDLLSSFVEISVEAVSVSSGSPVTNKFTPKTSANVITISFAIFNLLCFFINLYELQFIKFSRELFVISLAKYLLKWHCACDSGCFYTKQQLPID